jgi:predicted house-cleaning noncanonical NTP pyrophosphatase (MazG superfamily)
MRQKLVTLCPTTFELATKKRNFSAWIRRMLNEEADGYTADHYAEENARLQQLISEIIDGSKVWEQGYGWRDVDESP